MSLVLSFDMGIKDSNKAFAVLYAVVFGYEDLRFIFDYPFFQIVVRSGCPFRSDIKERLLSSKAYRKYKKRHDKRYPTRPCLAEYEELSD